MIFKANLPMYDWPELQSVLDRFWNKFSAEIKSAGYSIAETLDRNADEAIWLDDQLGLSQTCGFPLTHQLREQVRLLGTPTYHCDYFSEGLYTSVVLARHSDKRNTLQDFEHSTVAVNSLVSQSGFNALRNLLVDQQYIADGKPPFFSSVFFSGSHRMSMQAVAAAEADVCATDPVSFALAKQFEPAVASLKIIDSTAATPGLPLICSPRLFTDEDQHERYKLLVQQAWCAAAKADDVKALMLDAIIDIPRSAYYAVPCHEHSLFAPDI